MEPDLVWLSRDKFSRVVSSCLYVLKIAIMQ